jgi:hypothetical protein
MKDIVKQIIELGCSMAIYRFLAVFDVVTSLFFVFSSQFVLYILNGMVVGGFGLFVGYGFPSVAGGPVPTVHAPLPNYPLLVFVFMLIVNLLFFVVVKSRSRLFL